MFHSLNKLCLFCTNYAFGRRSYMVKRLSTKQRYRIYYWR